MNNALTTDTKFSLRNLINNSNIIDEKIFILGFVVFILAFLIIAIIIEIRNNIRNINNLFNNADILREDTGKLIHNTKRLINNVIMLKENNRRLFSNTDLLNNNQIIFRFERLCDDGNLEDIMEFMIKHTDNKKVFFQMNKLLLLNYPQLNHTILTKKTL